MAIYKYPQFLAQHQSAAFDTTHGPGTATPYSGIYRCENCGDNIAANQGQPLPPQNHRQHDPTKGAIVWRLIVATH